MCIRFNGKKVALRLPAPRVYRPKPPKSALPRDQKSARRAPKRHLEATFANAISGDLAAPESFFRPAWPAGRLLALAWRAVLCSLGALGCPTWPLNSQPTAQKPCQVAPSADFFVLFPSTALPFSKNARPTKNLGKTQVSHDFRSSTFARTLFNMVEKPLKSMLLCNTN